MKCFNVLSRNAKIKSSDLVVMVDVFVACCYSVFLWSLRLIDQSVNWRSEMTFQIANIHRLLEKKKGVSGADESSDVYIHTELRGGTRAYIQADSIHEFHEDSLR